MHDLATISVIQEIQPIEGKDRIVLTTVENYHSIVQKGEFKPGDKVIYVYYDAILPVRPEFEFLRKRCWSEKLQGFRIRPMKMGGAISEGLVLPLSLLSGGASLPLGTVVTEALGIRRYAPELQPPRQDTRKRWWMRYPAIRKAIRLFGYIKPHLADGYPSLIPKSDEENIERCWDRISSSDCEYIITEKMEGCAAMYVLGKGGRLHSYSHNREAGDSGCWREIARKLDIRSRLRKLRKQIRRHIAIEGEICGPGIQKNIYHFPEFRFFLYSAYDADTGKALTYTELCSIAAIMGIEQVPFIRRGKALENVETMLADVEGLSLHGKDIPCEGLVWRTEDGSVHFKCKSRSYKVWFEG